MEIGAIARSIGNPSSTILRKGVKFDKPDTHIAHNVAVGENTYYAAAA